MSTVLFITANYLSLIIVSALHQPALETFADNMTIRVGDPKNNTTVIKAVGSGDNTPVVINAVTAAGGIATILVGLKSYQQNRIVREKDITKDVVFPLINEFDNAEIRGEEIFVTVSSRDSKIDQFLFLLL